MTNIGSCFKEINNGNVFGQFLRSFPSFSGQFPTSENKVGRNWTPDHINNHKKGVIFWIVFSCFCIKIFLE